MALLVLKFGGTSVGDVERIKNAASKVAAEVKLGHKVAVVVSAMAVTAALFLLVLGLLLRSRKHPVVTGKEALLGAEGEALAWQQEEGRVRVQGEIWRARAAGPLAPGTRVKVVNREGLVLIVEPA